MLEVLSIYKYIKKKYLKKFIDTGEVRIGTIYWYRECENKRIRDEFEGRTKYTIKNQPESVILSKEQVNAITNDYHFDCKFENGPYNYFSDFLNVPNVFVFCTSLNYNRRLMEKFECDGCYKIVDFHKFANKLSEELNQKYPLFFTISNIVNYVVSKEIEITNENKNSVIRTDPYKKSVPNSDRIKTIYVEDYFTKPAAAFGDEDEFRLIFVSREPIGKDAAYIHCKKLVEYCEIIDS